MKRHCTFFVGLALIASASWVVAAESQSVPQPLRELARFNGNWVGEFTAPFDLGQIKKGDRVVFHLSQRWMLDKAYLAGDLSFEAGGKRIPGSHEIAHWDAANKKLVHSIFGANGIGAGEWLATGDKAMLRWWWDTQDGKVEGTSVMEAVDADTSIWQGVDVSLAGKKLPDWPKITLKRTRVARSGGAQEGASAEEYLRFWNDYFCGDWVTTIVKGEEEGSNKTGTKGTWKCEPSPTKTCMFFTDAADGGPLANAVAGYDPASGAWKEVFYFADGSHLTQFYRVASGELAGDPVGKQITGTAELATPNGKVEKSVVRVRFLGPDRCEYSVTQRGAGDKMQPEVVWIFERTQK